jgi:hypothetical protein
MRTMWIAKRTSQSETPSGYTTATRGHVFFRQQDHQCNLGQSLVHVIMSTRFIPQATSMITGGDTNRLGHYNPELTTSYAYHGCIRDGIFDPHGGWCENQALEDLCGLLDEHPNRRHIQNGSLRSTCNWECGWPFPQC